MSYLVLARKWRPQQLGEIAGQEHVTTTLTHALESGRVAHAFLFTGARGVGKTSAARILAKALCCERAGAPTPRPCGECGMCVEIAEGRATDVFEIDAASNTGVANVREIIENVRYLPGKARFKIYIIDEVHMLSVGAFNALLKTLEEPPPHVKFILATTDVHKVPVTILSRCQRYDFRRLPTELIKTQLAAILTEEGIPHEPSALALVAREAEGSMRDAQSLLEQVLTYGGARGIDGDVVRGALGVADRRIVTDTIAAILGHDPSVIVRSIRDVFDRGLDLSRFAGALVEEARNLVMAKLLPDPAVVVDAPKDEIAALAALAAGHDAVVLERLFLGLAKVVEGLAESSFPRFALEVYLVSLAEAPARVPIEALAETLERIEATLVTKGPSKVLTPPARSFRAAPRAEPEPPPAERAPPPAPKAPVAPSAPAVAPPAPPPAPPVAPPPPAAVAAPVAPQTPSAAPAPAAAPPAAVAEVAPPAPEPPPRPRGGPAPAFRDFVDVVKKRRPTLFGSLAQVRPVQFDAARVVLACDNRFDENTLGGAEVKRYLAGLLAELFGATPELVVERAQKGAAIPTMPKSLVELADDRRSQEREARAREARKSPAVRLAESILGAEVVRVRVDEAELDAADDDEPG